MDGDDDIARLLPEPPPPRPSRRDATIALAMQRFDGETGTAPAAARAAPAATPWWSARRAQIGAFASIAVVALVAIPLALEHPGGVLSGADPTAPSPPAEQVAATNPSPAQAPSSANRTAGKQAAALPAPTPAAPVASKPAPKASGADWAEPASQDKSAGLLAAPAPQPAAEPAPGGAIVVTGSRVVTRQAESVSAISVVTSESLEDSKDVVVTGTRTRARKAAGRGDWNACTVLDPRQSLSACRQLVDPGAKGDAGSAAGWLGDALSLGWANDWRGAIAAFDQLIALRPRSGFAYLNRGLAYDRAGEPAKALADLDRAIRYAPREARNYYHRSLLRRASGNQRGADADLERAEGLDPQYAGLDD